MPTLLIGLPVTTILRYLWAAFGAYWLLSAFRQHASKAGERSSLRFLRLAIMVATFSLLLAYRPWSGVLSRQFLQPNLMTVWGGISLTVMGLAVAVWARVHLGQYWSDKVEIKVDHQLIRTGPYATMRHPIYSGVLLAVAGTALAIGQWRGVVAFAVALTNWTIKAKREERILSRQFGAQFESHKAQTGFLIPKI